MINLSHLLKQKKVSGTSQPANAGLIRDKLLVKEVQEMEENLPKTCTVYFSNPSILHSFKLTVRPTDSYWAGGIFHFSIEVGELYNFSPPQVKCLTRIWHPNIDQDGKLCLSILRQSSVDSAGWAPTRRLKDVIWGVESLFGDLCDFNDALNTEAADEHNRDSSTFKKHVQRYIADYCKR